MFCTRFEGTPGWLELSLSTSFWYLSVVDETSEYRPVDIISSRLCWLQVLQPIHLKYLCCCNSQAARLCVNYGREKGANRVHELQCLWTACFSNIEYSTHSVGDKALSGRRGRRWRPMRSLCMHYTRVFWAHDMECETDCSIGVTEVDCTDKIFYPRDSDKLMT